jgi:drug/metabolite transporter (DMT)-like permease
MTLGLTLVALTVLLTVYGQIIIKWQVGGLELPPGIIEKVVFVLRQYLNPWVLSAFLAAFLASMSWVAAMTLLELSFAYPFMSTSFILVIVLSAVLFNEPLTWQKLAGTAIIVIGLIVLNR